MMKKLITVSMLLVMTILGLVFGYQNLASEELDSESFVKIPYLADEEPVAATVMTIAKPYNAKDVKIAVDFYDKTKENQENSIIVIDKTFIPNKGVLYQSEKAFDVLAIYDGEVIEVGKDDLTGNYVRINHNNNLVATYKILDNINLKKGDQVRKGDKIGTSANSQINTGNLLLLELESSYVNVNPEDYYNKTIKEI